MSAVETHTLPNSSLTLELHHDEDPMNPRTEYDNLGTMVCFHRRYVLGDEHSYATPEDFFEDLIHQALTQPERDRRDRVQDLLDRIPSTFDERYNWVPKADFVDRHAFLIKELDRLRDAALARYVILPLYLYDHSGITISTGSFSCPWDSGQVGWIYMTLDEARSNWPNESDPIEAATRCLKGEVDEYDKFLTGEAYGYTITSGSADGNGEELTSCWGYLGLEFAREDGLAELKALADQLPLQHELSL